MRKLALVPVVIALAGCSNPEFRAAFGLEPVPVAVTTTVAPVEPVETLDPDPPPPPPAGARTAEEFDTTSEEDRAAAVEAPAAPGAVALGTTIASLGSPTVPGIWLETGLVTELAQGRVETAEGASVAVELRPSGGAASAGSQISLAAMRLLDVPLTALPELTVYRD